MSSNEFDSSDSEIESDEEDEMMVDNEPVGPNILDFYDIGKDIGKYVYIFMHKSQSQASLIPRSLKNLFFIFTLI
jgi:hypothetical protein